MYSVISLVSEDIEKSGVGLVTLKGKDKSSICLRKFYLDGMTSDKLCYELDPNEKLANVIEIG